MNSFVLITPAGINHWIYFFLLEKQFCAILTLKQWGET